MPDESSRQLAHHSWLKPVKLKIIYVAFIIYEMIRVICEYSIQGFMRLTYGIEWQEAGITGGKLQIKR